MDVSYFFDLSTCKHRGLFEHCEDVWTIPSKIPSYFESISLGKIEVDIPDGVHLIDPAFISIGKGTSIEPGAYIKGPCVIGENCTIRNGAYLRGYVLTGDHCVLGHTSEFKNVLLLNHACAAHFSYVGDSILGNRVNLGAGTVCANLRFDKQPIVFDLEGKRIETGLRKLGAIIGDETQTGCNSVTNPGTLLGKRVCCYPCTNFGGFIPSDRVVHHETKILVSQT